MSGRELRMEVAPIPCAPCAPCGATHKPNGLAGRQAGRQTDKLAAGPRSQPWPPGEAQPRRARPLCCIWGAFDVRDGLSTYWDAPCVPAHQSPE